MHRQSNLELLRIFAMFLIVAHHFVLHGNWPFTQNLEFRESLIFVLGFGGKLGVNLFVLISGYFLVSKEFRWAPVVDILSKTWFYSIAIAILLYFTKIVELNSKDIVKALLPFSYWFVNAFIAMLLASPFINLIIKKLDRKHFTKLLLVFFILIVTPIYNSTVGSFGFFVFLYMIGAYIRLYLPEKSVGKTALLISSFLFLLVIVFSIITIGVYTTFGNPLILTGMKTPFVLALSVSLFLLFRELQIGSLKLVNGLAGTMFGVYLIHDNFLFRDFVWIKLFDIASLLKSEYLFIYSFCVITSVFLSCAVIDFVLQKAVSTLKLNVHKKYISKKLEQLCSFDFSK